MFHYISLSQYFITLVIATIIYYLFLWIVVFKAKILPAFSNLRVLSQQAEDAPDEMLTSAQFIMDELRAVFPHKQNKNELILALQTELKRYAGWDDTAFRDTINKFIVHESQSTYSIRLDDEDICTLWK